MYQAEAEPAQGDLQVKEAAPDFLSRSTFAVRTALQAAENHADATDDHP